MRRRSAAVLAALVLVATGLGCPGDQVRQIAVVLPLSGGAQAYGEAIRDGIALAQEETAASPDYPYQLRLAVEDSQSDAPRAAEILARLFDQGAFAALGGVTTEAALTMIEVADREQKVLLSPSATSPRLAGISRYFFRTLPSDTAEASHMANFLAQKLDIHALMLLAEPLGRPGEADGETAAHEELTSQGIEVTETLDLPPGGEGLAAVVERVVAAAPAVVYLEASGPEVADVVRQLRQRGFAGRIFTTHAFGSRAVLVRVGEAARGVVFTRYFDPDSDQAGPFVAAFRRRYDREPDMYAGLGYDAFRVLAAALAQGRPTLPSELPRALRAVEDFPGVTGILRFNERGEVTKFPNVYIIRDDLKPYDYAKLLQEKQDRIDQIKQELDRLRQQGIRSGSG